MARIIILAPEDLPIPPVRGGSVQIYLHTLLPYFAHNSWLSCTLISPTQSSTPLVTSDSNSYKQILLQKGEKYHSQALTLLKNESPDIIQIDNRPKLIPLLRKTIPQAKLILNLHSTTFLGSRYLSQNEAREALITADHVICNSQYLKRELASRFHLCAKDWKPSVIYPGVDLQKFRPVQKRQHPHMPLRLLFVGRVIAQKGVHVLVDSIRHLERKHIPVTLTLIGRTPPWEANYEKRIRQSLRNLPIFWKGFMTPEDLPQIYQEADVFLCPSQKNEAFGLVNLEALSSGLPVVASYVGGIPEIVNSQCGQLLKNHQNPISYAEAIAKYVLFPELWHTQSIAAIQRAEKFNWQQTAQNFLTLYRKYCVPIFNGNV